MYFISVAIILITLILIRINIETGCFDKSFENRLDKIDKMLDELKGE